MIGVKNDTENFVPANDAKIIKDQVDGEILYHETVDGKVKVDKQRVVVDPHKVSFDILCVEDWIPGYPNNPATKPENKEKLQKEMEQTLLDKLDEDPMMFE